MVADWRRWRQLPSPNPHVPCFPWSLLLTYEASSDLWHTETEGMLIMLAIGHHQGGLSCRNTCLFVAPIPKYIPPMERLVRFHKSNHLGSKPWSWPWHTSHLYNPGIKKSFCRLIPFCLIAMRKMGRRHVLVRLSSFQASLLNYRSDVLIGTLFYRTLLLQHWLWIIYFRDFLPLTQDLVSVPTPWPVLLCQ